MLVQRRLDTLRELVAEYGMMIGVTLVKFNLNRADRLTKQRGNSASTVGGYNYEDQIGCNSGG